MFDSLDQRQTQLKQEILPLDASLSSCEERLDHVEDYSIRELQASIDESNLRRANEIEMAEKFKLGADLYDDGIRWMKLVVKAEQSDLNAEQIDQELDRRKAIKRQVEEAGLYHPLSEGELIEKI